jgi:hypothetical protein
MLTKAAQQRLMAQMNAVESAYGYNTAALTPVQVYKTADELHGLLKPLIHKR